jgi:hypothetical protein
MAVGRRQRGDAAQVPPGSRPKLADGLGVTLFVNAMDTGPETSGRKDGDRYGIPAAQAQTNDIDPTLQSLVDAHPGALRPGGQELPGGGLQSQNTRKTYAGAARPTRWWAGPAMRFSHKVDSNCKLKRRGMSPWCRCFQTASPVFQVIHRHFDHLHDPRLRGDPCQSHPRPGWQGGPTWGESITSISHDNELHFDEQKMVGGLLPLVHDRAAQTWSWWRIPTRRC